MTKILLVDDEPNILMLTKVLFRDQGYEVTTAENGRIAIEKALKIKPDIIITDLIMPEKDGFEVCKFIRNTPDLADIPIIILSAMGDEYNKITGFEGGADDYVTKPFNVEELKARVKAILNRHQIKKTNITLSNVNQKSPPPPPSNSIQETNPKQLISTGLKVLDQALQGGLPKGSNLLVIGPLGKGKSTFARKFIAQGLKNNERCLFITLDDPPMLIRENLSAQLPKPISAYEDIGQIRFVDAYSWSSLVPGGGNQNEPFSVNGILELNQLSGVISDASFELGQTVQNKLGGRRVIDSISSLLVNFELPSVQRFINQIGRTAIAFGGVTSLFLMEEGTVNEQILNNIKYIMDGIIEFTEIDNKKQVRIASMKWSNYDNQWHSL